MRIPWLATGIVAIAIAMAGCEDDEDNGTSPVGGGYSEVETISAIGEARPSTGAIVEIVAGDWQVLLAAGTEVQVEKPDGSGMENVSPSSIGDGSATNAPAIGDLIEFDIPPCSTTYYPVKQTTPTWARVYHAGAAE